MLTKAQKIQAYEMVLDGVSYEEIGNKVGVSRQRIQQLFGHEPRQRAGHMKCIYTGLSKWLQENMISAESLKKSCFNGMSIGTIYLKMTGKVRITVPEAKAILKYTGLTFEEAFGQENDQ